MVWPPLIRPWHGCPFLFFSEGGFYVGICIWFSAWRFGDGRPDRNAGLVAGVRSQPSSRGEAPEGFRPDPGGKTEAAETATPNRWRRPVAAGTAEALAKAPAAPQCGAKARRGQWRPEKAAAGMCQGPSTATSPRCRTMRGSRKNATTAKPGSMAMNLENWPMM